MSPTSWVRPVLIALLCGLLSPPGPVLAVPMLNDPNGYEGFAWGAPLADSGRLTQVDSGFATKGYELKQKPPKFGEVLVDSLRFFTVHGKFGRVVVHYHGDAVHAQIMRYLQDTFGPIDRTPGQVASHLNQQYTWRGPESEINLTYDAVTQRANLFLESRTLAPRFNEFHTDSSE